MDLHLVEDLDEVFTPLAVLHSMRWEVYGFGWISDVEGSVFECG